MRVLLDDQENIHALLPVGRFTISQSQDVTWYTPYEPLRSCANQADDEVLLPPELDGRIQLLANAHGELLDALVLSESRTAMIVKRDNVPWLMLWDSETSQLLADIPLIAEAQRLDCFRLQEHWSSQTTFRGSSGRGLRLFATPEGMTITANESGHVAILSFESKMLDRVFRVPAAPENTVYAAKVKDGLLVGMLWNHRHSELYLVSDEGDLIAKWPPEGEVRWAMPTPVVLGDRIVVYSDEGPNARTLHLLKLPTFEEIAYLPVFAAPSDVHGDPSTNWFVAAMDRGILQAHVEDDEFDESTFWHVNELMEMGGVEGIARPNHATLDGRGERIWLETQVTHMGVHQGAPIVRLSESHEIVALDGSAEGRIIVAGKPKEEKTGQARLWAIFDAPRHDLVDCRQGALLFHTDEGISRMGVQGGTEELVVRTHLDMGCVRQLANGIWYVARDADDSDTFHVYWFGADEDAQKSPSGQWLSTFKRRGLDSIAAFAEANDVWWYEYGCTEEIVREAVSARGVLQQEIHTTNERFTLRRWCGNTQLLQTWTLERPIEIMAAFQGTAYVVTRGRHSDPEGYYKTHLWRVLPDGSLEQISKHDLGTVTSFVVGQGEAFWVDPAGISNQGTFPATLKRLDMATGKVDVLVEATFGDLSHVTIDHGKLWWLESGSMADALYARDSMEDCASVSCLALQS